MLGMEIQANAKINRILKCKSLKELEIYKPEKPQNKYGSIKEELANSANDGHELGLYWRINFFYNIKKFGLKIKSFFKR